jgi:NADPH:quinone reductase
MTHAIRFAAPGGPEVLSWDEVELAPPKPGEVRLRHTAVGLNFIDTYQRSGLYPLSSYPAILGSEAAGVVEALGEGVTGLAVGDRVAYGTAPGAYAEARNVAADRVVPLPKGIDDAVAASIMLKGMTAEYLLHRTYPVRAGETILVHAAAGGVGLILCQWARALGATVIGTVGTEEKAALAAQNGCDHPILYRSTRFADEVKRITRGQGVSVVYDSVGKDTWEQSFESVRRRGMLVFFGQSSGLVPPIDLRLLSQKGSLFVTRPSLGDYTATRDELTACAASLLRVVEAGTVRITIGQRYPLRDAARAHADLEGRKTTGATVLEP